jgi:hypothetical protein
MRPEKIPRSGGLGLAGRNDNYALTEQKKNSPMRPPGIDKNKKKIYH